MNSEVEHSMSETKQDATALPDPNYVVIEQKAITLLSGIISRQASGKIDDTLYLEPRSEASEEGFRALALLLRMQGPSREAAILRVAELLDPDIRSEREPRRLVFEKRKEGTGTIHDPRKSFAIATNVLWHKSQGKSLEQAWDAASSELDLSFTAVRDAYYKAKKAIPVLFLEEPSS